jgi:site-specific DNA recombinase
MNQYALYARRSKEDGDSQQRSIEEQIRSMTAIAVRDGLALAKTYSENKSAKEPDQRPVFDELIAGLNAGTYNCLLCYHLNRLARNMVEAGLLQHMLSKGIIREIRTANEVFRTKDNILPFIFQTAQSAQFSLDLSDRMRLSKETKLGKGEYPQRALEGYINNSVMHRIDVDPARFPIVKRAWEHMATGAYSVEAIRALMDEWGYTTRPSLKRGGKPISRNALYRMFRNPMYAGMFLHSGGLHKGAHEPMVTWELFESVQRILKSRSRPRHSRHDFAYTTLIVCGACGRRLTAEFQRGRHGRGSYVYYHCSNVRSCRSGRIPEGQIEDLVADALCRVAINPQYLDQAIAVVEDQYAGESAKDIATLELSNRELEQAERKMRELVRMGMKSLISDEEFLTERGDLQAKINNLKVTVSKNHDQLEYARRETIRVAEFIATAETEFRNGDVHKRRELARRLGAAYVFTDGVVTLEPKEVLAPLLKDIEPLKTGSENLKRTLSVESVPFGSPDGTMFEPLRQVWNLLLQDHECKLAI